MYSPEIYLVPSDSGALVKKLLIFKCSCATVDMEQGRMRRRGKQPAAVCQIPHDAQVRRISWVRGVGRPALAHSGLLVPLPTADRPPILPAVDQIAARKRWIRFRFHAQQKTPPRKAALDISGIPKDLT
jgi:hypothetical protein